VKTCILAAMQSRSLEQMRENYGQNYPCLILVDGESYPLEKETRWSRVYRKPNGDHVFEFSRFMDGSATFTVNEIETKWETWSSAEQLNFCQAVSFGWINDQPYALELFRFLWRFANEQIGSAIALASATVFPREEAFQLLKNFAAKISLSHVSNALQAIAYTQHPEAKDLLISYLDKLWAVPELWDDDEFINWPAYSCVCCIDQLIEYCDMPANETEERVRQLSAHINRRTRESCHRQLGRWYSWLDQIPDSEGN
jgi:hypothetical protein